MITDRFRGHGAWSLRLRDDTPLDIVDNLDFWETVLFTDEPVDYPGLNTDAAMQQLATYTGVITSVERGNEPRLGGHGLLYTLGDLDEGGQILTAEWAGPGTKTFANWITDLFGTLETKPAPLNDGTVTAVSPPAAGQFTGTFQHLNRRQILDILCDYYGGEYRVQPDFTIDAGPSSSLFTTTPTAIAVRDTPGGDPNVDGLEVASLRATHDVDDWFSQAVIYGDHGGEDVVVKTATVAVNPYKNGLGTAMLWQVAVDLPEMRSAALAQVMADVKAAAVTATRQTVDLSLFEVQGKFVAGDWIWIHDLAGGLVDTANEVRFRGEVYHPAKVRVFALTSPFRGGAYHRDKNGVFTDLTPFVVAESGSASVEIGGKPPLPPGFRTRAAPARAYQSLPIHVEVENTSPQTFSTGTTYSTLTLPTVTRDANSLWDTGTDTHVNVATAGLYLLTATVHWESNVVGDRAMRFATNITGTPATTNLGKNVPAGAGEDRFALSGAVYLAAGEVGLQVWQTANVDLDVLDCWMTVVKL